MGEVTVRRFGEEDVETLTNIIYEAWDYYVQEAQIERIKELIQYYLGDDSKEFWLAYEDENLVGVAELTITESYRYAGEEGKLEIMYIRDSASNYYDVHTSLMNAIFEFLKEENIEYLRIDTALENADVLFV